MAEEMDIEIKPRLDKSQGRVWCQQPEDSKRTIQAQGEHQEVWRAREDP